MRGHCTCSRRRYSISSARKWTIVAHSSTVPVGSVRTWGSRPSGRSGWGAPVASSLRPRGSSSSSCSAAWRLVRASPAAMVRRRVVLPVPGSPAMRTCLTRLAPKRRRMGCPPSARPIGAVVGGRSARAASSRSRGTGASSGRPTRSRHCPSSRTTATSLTPRALTKSSFRPRTRSRPAASWVWMSKLIMRDRTTPPDTLAGTRWWLSTRLICCDCTPS